MEIFQNKLFQMTVDRWVQQDWGDEEDVKTAFASLSDTVQRVGVYSACRFVDMPDYEGNFPLIEMIRAQNYSLVEKLIVEGHSLYVRNAAEETPLSVAEQGSKMIAAFVKSGKYFPFSDQGEALRQAAERGDLQGVQDCLSKKAPVGEYSTLGETALHIACRVGNLPIVQALLDSSTSSINAPTSRGLSSPLHIAVEAGNWKVVAELVKRGARLNLLDDYARLPVDLVRNRVSVRPQGVECLKRVKTERPLIPMPQLPCPQLPFGKGTPPASPEASPLSLSYTSTPSKIIPPDDSRDRTG
ncbi:MAG: ankyrin repeat domain-containing protein [Parachlamydiales bacterium]